MSPSKVFPGLQSCLDPGRLVETRVLRLELATTARKKPFVTTDSDCEPKSFNKKKNSNHDNNNVDRGGGGWSFLQSLSNNIVSSQMSNENDKIYTPPSIKRSCSILSEKSLEMCTESLGNETGSDVNCEVNTTDHDQMDFLDVENKNINYSEATYQERSKIPKGTRRMNRSATFPPPLTSISGSTSVQVRPHREEGRLVLQAVSVSSCFAYFHAERSNGRLRLHLVNDCSNDCSDLEEEQEEEKKEERVGGEEEEEDGEVYNYRDEDDLGDGLGEDMEGNSDKAGGEMGNLAKNLQRPSRCNEGGSDGGGGNGTKALLNWEPFWVAT